MASMKGVYKPSNPKKYIGNPNQIVYRSGWERKFMVYLDSRETVQRWGSEEIAIKYWNPMKKKVARYFPDFYVEYVKKGGGIKKCLIEIKPHRECSPPKYTKRTKNVMIAESLYAQNTAKWKAAEEFCLDNGLEFRILTEKDLFKNG
ncbi:head completion protein [Synechococcus phage ACG-2014f]|uniref:Head completion nuclease n=2 Tax=Atlauavirus TaxID=2733092 RepID=A0A0E3EUX4_9CAUD|nr:head closure [Synechococcus phage ACG-2014f_Syn7803C7]AIX18303.1 head completion protein [Synechococcus phage ACG-2014f]AIX19895.1 head completion protein [Synechococcus phage ACG-2014f_Syn7803C7]AIX20181.1 head completion protein [Synechococcus phage ACG-2014f]AIX23194.1 head completion protein [Synechococcus phage ACG-2014f]AIX29115.1 head completion protein [Synechococcus phage ACG-2014f]